MSNEEKNSVELELYEMGLPGQLVGKEVVDSLARKVGVVRSVKIRFFPLHVMVIIKGLGVEFSVNGTDIEAISKTIVKLNKPAKQANEIEIDDVYRLRDEIYAEMKTIFAKIRT
jgi:sporulation protein YlmC with PRC-barrel domain